MNKPFLSKQEFTLALPSVVIGLSILALPASVAHVTARSDGWIAILMAGLIATFIALMAVKVASYFPGQSFVEYATTLVTKPVAMMITCLYIGSVIVLCAYTTRSVSYITQQYLFDKTPLEVIGLLFMLIVIYAVSGSRIGLFRLNMLFLPIIITLFLLVGFLNIKWMDVNHFSPFFTTGITGYSKAVLEAFEGFVGVGIGLFYVFMIQQPVNLRKQVVTGMGITIFFYIFIFLSTIGVFGNMVTANLTLPTLELALKVDIPRAVFERVDAFVYAIWIMSIFNTVAILYDIAVLLLMSVFTKWSKPITVIMLAPLIFFIGMFPKSMDIVNQLTRLSGLLSLFFTCMVIVLFYIMIKWKGISNNETS